MPIYEYACEKCGDEFEVEQRITDDPVKSCPSCRSRKVKKLISQTSFVLKGGGWYSDLYSSKKGKGDDKSEKTDSTGDDGKTAKPDPKKSDGGKSDTGKSDSSKADTKKPSGKGDKGGRGGKSSKAAA